MPITLQPSLPISLDVHGKCVDRAGALSILGCEYWQLDPLIEQGSISWAINIASKSAGRLELRFPVVCVHDCQAGLRRDYDADQIARILFGPALTSDLCPLTSALISAKRFYQALVMKPCHAYALIADGSLRIAKGSTRRRGPGGSAWITWLDAIHFLTTHRHV